MDTDLVTPSLEAMAVVDQISLPDGSLRLKRSDSKLRPGGTADSATASRPPGRFITVAWGDRYVHDLLTLAIPALLAPGNLPHLLEHFDCEFVIVTEINFFDLIAAAPQIAAVLNHCTVRLVPIDDLLSAWYGITLTYGYVRGFADLGEDMTKTHLFFLNSDFIVAAGSYRKLVDAVLGGDRLIVAPSYCMVQEEAIDLLRDHHDPATSTMAIEPRAMAGLILSHRHNTIRAKTVNQRLFRIHRYDQFYWLVDEHTMLSRQMPIALVYMRPQVAVTEMSSYWDYSVESEYCPDIPARVLADSDDFLIGELRTASTFQHLLGLGWPRDGEIAADLSSFTTRDHRELGSHILTLHSRDLPGHLDDERAAFARYIHSVDAELRPPISYRDHPFWAVAIPEFRRVKAAQFRDRQRKERVRDEVTSATVGVLRTRLRDLQTEWQFLEQDFAVEKREYVTQIERLDQEYQARLRAIESDIESVHGPFIQRLAAVRRECEDLRGRLAQAILEREKEIERRLAGDGDPLAPLAAAAPPRDVADPHAPPAHPANSDPAAEKAAAISETSLVPESPPPPAMRRNQLLAILLQRAGAIYRSIFGRLPFTKIWHPYHLALAPAVEAISSAGNPYRVLVLTSGPGLGALLAGATGGSKFSAPPTMIMNGLYDERLESLGKFDLCICDLAFEELLDFRSLFKKLHPLMRPKGRLVVFHHNSSRRQLSDRAYEFTHRVFPLIGKSMISFAGSLPSVLAMRWYANALYHRNIYTPLGLAVVAPTLAICACLARFAARIEGRRPRYVYPARCTSLTITIDLTE